VAGFNGTVGIGSVAGSPTWTLCKSVAGAPLHDTQGRFVKAANVATWTAGGANAKPCFNGRMIHLFNVVAY
jgi:hypothetical protein